MSKNVRNVPSQALIPEVSASILDGQVFKEKHTIGIVPFKAGPNAAENDELDQLSLMLAKGIKETLSDNNAFTFLTKDQGRPDLVLDGYIEDFSQRSHLMGHGTAHLSVDGEIWFQQTGLKALIYSSSKDVDVKKENVMEAAYEMGRTIGSYIEAQLKS